MTYGGYHHGYLHIRLDGHQLSVHRPTLTDATLRRTLGGVGLGVHLLLNHQGPTADLVTGPLAFVFSPLVGSPGHHIRQIRRCLQEPTHFSPE